MTNYLSKVKTLLVEEIQEKIKVLPFGFGQEEGCEGFPKWSVYIDAKSELHGKPSLIDRFDESITVLENLAQLPIDKLTLLAEHGLSGNMLFKQMQEDYVLGNGMGSKAWEDANQWKNKSKHKL